MKKHVRILVALTFLFGLGVAAKAETRAEIVVKLPFQFSVGGKTLPAGTYKVSHLSNDPFSVLRLTSYDNAASVYVLPFSIASTSTDKPQVEFKQVGEHYLLSSIQTEDYVYDIPVSRSLVMAAAAKPNDAVSVSISVGGNYHS